MRPFRSALLAGLAVAACVGLAQTARPRDATTHTLTIQLPNDSVEQVRYVRTPAPRMVAYAPGFAPGFAPMMAVPVLAPDFASPSPFVAFERLSAAMDQQAAAMLQAAASGFGAMPLDGQSRMIVAGLGDGGICARSVTITSSGAGQRPIVVSQMSGACGPGTAGPAPRGTIPAEQVRPVPQQGPARTIEVMSPSAPPATPAHPGSPAPDLTYRAAGGRRSGGGCYKPASYRLPEGYPAMAIERTLSILKPDATRRNLTGAINARFEESGLRIVAQKRLQLTTAQAEAFYAVHRERGFFRDLVVVHVLRAGRRPGVRGRGRGRPQPGNHGCDGPGEGRRRDHPRELRREHRGELGAWLRQC